ncbi:hypothetical protein ACA910_018744 [Epithemia clementina (nom. ined.)]
MERTLLPLHPLEPDDEPEKENERNDHDFFVESNDTPPLPPLENDDHDDPDALRSLDEVLEAASSSPIPRLSWVISWIIPSSSSSSSSSSSLPSLSFPAPQETKVLWSEWRYWRLFVCLGICNSSDAAEILCLSYVLANADFQTHMLWSSAWRASVLASVVFAGMLVGGLWASSSSVVGHSNNSNSAGSSASTNPPGRKSALLQGLALNAVASTLAAVCSTNVGILSLFRFFSGVGIGYSIPPLFTLAAELAPARDRGFWGALVASFWMVGAVFVAITAWILFQGWDANWRVVMMVCTVPSALGWTLVYWWVPESPRYLAWQGQTEEAVRVMNHLTTQMLRAQHVRPWTLREARHQYSTFSALSSTLSSSSSNSFVDSDSERRSNPGRWVRGMTKFFKSIALLYSTKQLQGTTLPLQAVWFTLSFGSYGLSTWINTLFAEVHLQNIYLNALIFASSSFPGNVLSIFLLDTCGRSTVLTGSLLSAAMSLVAFAYIAYVDAKDDDDYNKDANNNNKGGSSLPKSLIVLSACAFQCCAVIAWNTLAVLTPELYPTSVRNSGMALCGASGRVGAMVAQIFIAFTVHKPSRMLSIAAATVLFGALSPFCFLPPDKTRQTVDDDRIACHRPMPTNNNVNESLSLYKDNDGGGEDENTSAGCSVPSLIEQNNHTNQRGYQDHQII